METLRESALDIQREVRSIPVSREAVDLVRVSREHPDARRFYVIGYDTFQVPVYVGEFARRRAPL